MNDIINSWEENADEWIKAISKKSIASRKFTDKAIVDAVLSLKKNKIVDIGCGEGWLTKALTDCGKNVIGIDTIERLLQSARRKSNAPFYNMTFEEISNGNKIPHHPFDIAVFNFCLYNKEGVLDLLRNTKKALTESGTILIQTLHPFFLIAQNLPYKSQWIEDSWRGLEGNFKNGHSWYARTFEDWSMELQQIPKSEVSFKEIINAERHPISLLITIQKTV